MLQPELSTGNMNIIAQKYYAVLFCNSIDRQGATSILLRNNIVHLGAALVVGWERDAHHVLLHWTRSVLSQTLAKSVPETVLSNGVFHTLSDPAEIPTDESL